MWLIAACVGLAGAPLSTSPRLYSALAGRQVYRATDLSQVDIATQWDAEGGERAVVAFFRSFG